LLDQLKVAQRDVSSRHADVSCMCVSTLFYANSPTVKTVHRELKVDGPRCMKQVVNGTV